jgi:predicted nucleic acid-binding protein
VTRCYVADTYAWFAYFDGNPSYREIMSTCDLLTPAMVVAELARVLARRGNAGRNAMLDFVSTRGAIIPMDFRRAVAGGETAAKDGFALADAIIYSHATKEAELLTGDEHFRGRKNVHFVK